MESGRDATLNQSKGFVRYPFWEEGPYEVRVAARCESHGDRPPALVPGRSVRGRGRVLAAAAAPGADEHVKMLADMIVIVRAGHAACIRR